MPLQYSVTIRNNQLDQVESTIGTSPILYLRTGAPPTDCAAADTGTLLCTIPLPADWMAAASGGSKAKLGTWSAAASASGTAGHFRIKDSSGTTCHLQGTVGTSGADLNLDNTSFNTGQTIIIAGFTINALNA